MRIAPEEDRRSIWGRRRKPEVHRYLRLKPGPHKPQLPEVRQKVHRLWAPHTISLQSWDPKNHVDPFLLIIFCVY
jgi:hypothetical protein